LSTRGCYDEKLTNKDSDSLFQSHGRWKGGQGEPLPPWILKFLAKMVAFLVLSGKKFHHFRPPPWKNLEKSPSAPPGKNPSDAHVQSYKRLQSI